MASVPSTDFDVAALPTPAQRRRTNVLIVSSVALAFISFWRAAAIVLCDLASTAYYIGGISEEAIGKAAPWFILGVMLFSYAVRAVYVESCTMFTRGGVYRVVKGAIGGGLAKLSVSALMFDYILTGPISAVAAGQYMVGLVIDMLNLINRMHHHTAIDPTHYQGTINFVSVALAIGTTLYFWRLNIKGIHESSDKALRIMQLTGIMGVLILAWSAFTLLRHHTHIEMPPFHPIFTDNSLTPDKESSKGWLEGLPRIIGALGILVAFGHTLLAMSGEESLAQVNREIEAPKLKNLLRAGFVIFIFSMLLTCCISFFAVLIIPDGMRVQTQIVLNGHETNVAGVDYVEVDYLRKPDARHAHDWGYLLDRTTDNEGVVHVNKTDQVVVIDRAKQHVERDNGGYRDNLINGLVHYLAGPEWLKIIMEIFVVIVGFLILAGAVNTSIVGSNGVLNRLAEDGVLTPWFQHPQARFGTTHRLINLIAILQIIVIVASLGDVDKLGEAYAFGVIWSFVFMTMSMVVLRFKDKSRRLYEVPLNVRIHRKPKNASAPATGASGEPAKMAEGQNEQPPPRQADGAAASAAVPVGTDNLGHPDAIISQATPADDVAPKPAIPQLGEVAAAGSTIDLPIGISAVFLILLSTALINLLTKKTATIWGVSFTIAFLAAFIILERITHHRRRGKHHEHLEQFNEKSSEQVDAASLGLTHPSPVLVAVRGPRSMPILTKILQETDTEKRDVVVVTCKVLPPRTPGITPQETSVDDDDRELLTKIVTTTEEVGKQVFPMVLPTNNPLYGIATAARDLHASEVVLGVSQSVHAETQLEQFAVAWGAATSTRGSSFPITVRIIGPNVEVKYELE